MRRLRLMIALVMVAAVSGCGPDKLSSTEYRKWFSDEENGVSPSRTIGEFEFRVRYISPDYLALQQFRDGNPDSEEFTNERMRFEGVEQYVFRIHRTDETDVLEGEYEEDCAMRLEYFVTYAQDDIHLVRGTDTLSCVQYTYERTYGLSPDLTIVVGFEADSSQSVAERTFVFNDNVLGVGPVKLTIDKNAFQNIPVLSHEE